MLSIFVNITISSHLNISSPLLIILDLHACHDGGEPQKNILLILFLSPANKPCPTTSCARGLCLDYVHTRSFPSVSRAFSEHVLSFM